jgi:hypothetical protein
MRSVFEFLKTTLIGGLLILLPVAARKKKLGFPHRRYRRF